MPGFLKRLLIVGPPFALAYIVATAIYPALSGPDGYIWSMSCGFSEGEIVSRRRGFICSEFTAIAVSGALGVLTAGIAGYLALRLYLANRK